MKQKAAHPQCQLESIALRGGTEEEAKALSNMGKLITSANKAITAIIRPWILYIPDYYQIYYNVYGRGVRSCNNKR